MDFINKILIFDDVWFNDKKRKAFLIKIISFICFFITLIKFLGDLKVADVSENHFEFLFFPVLALTFIILLVKKGHIHLVSYLTIVLIVIFSLKGSFVWGIDSYTIYTIYPFIIFLSSILIGSKFSLLVFLLFCFNLIFTFFLQRDGYFFENYFWIEFSPNFFNLLTILIVYLLMTFLFWVSSKGIENTLDRSKKLAQQLKLHNKRLEIVVEKKTNQLKMLQFKQLTKIAPLLDLGKLSAGLIHDIREPLSVLSVILQDAQQNKNIVHDLDKAFLAINKIDDLSKISSCKLFSESELEVFNLNQEIYKLISLFEYNSRLKKIKIIFAPHKEFELHADRKKLIQVLTNLLLNALESYDNVEKKEKYVFIKLVKKPRNLLIVIKDYGIGIKTEQLTHIFEPGFSSKDMSGSLGFGLYVSQEVMREIFYSKIRVASKDKIGSSFSLFIKNKFVLN